MYIGISYRTFDANVLFDVAVIMLRGSFQHPRRNTKAIFFSSPITSGPTKYENNEFLISFLIEGLLGRIRRVGCNPCLGSYPGLVFWGQIHNITSRSRSGSMANLNTDLQLCRYVVSKKSICWLGDAYFFFSAMQDSSTDYK